jgi:glutamate--cysteine ligase
MIKSTLHKDLCTNSNKLTEWYCQQMKSCSYPIYSSYDIRDAGFKISNVDANIFPAGFNNICQTDRDNAVDLMRQYLSAHYQGVQSVLLLAEEHTGNAHYWDNVATIRGLLTEADMKVMVGVPRNLETPWQQISAKGIQVEVQSAFGDSEAVKKFKPDLIISNNDFSNAHDEWAKTIQIPVNPPRGLGWYQRKKSRYFHHYNQLVNEFCALVGLDPFILNVKTELFEKFNLDDEDAIKKLASAVDQMIAELKQEYSKRGITAEPFVFVKNNAGTYGLAVVRVGSGQEVIDWNYKSRKKMKAAKGGNDVVDVIIQEGIPSRVQNEGATAEPVIYMIGHELAGGFLRSHAEKDSTESLNSPGAVYKRLCVSDLNVSLDSYPLENVYGWSARLGLLAIGHEAREMGVSFLGYHPEGK